MVSESDLTVQAHGVHTAYIEMASALERRDDVEVIRGHFDELIDCDIVHFQTIGSRTWRKLAQKGVKKVTSVHVVPASFIGSIIFAKYWAPIMRQYMRWFYGKADKLLAVSGTVADILRDELHIPAEKIEVFYNTIDMGAYKATPTERAAARERLGITKDAFVVVGNGQVQPRKRVDIFTKMAEELPDVQFYWVGGITFKRLGADYAAMQKLMNTTPKNFTITGVIDHQKVRDYLWAADVFCLPAEQENHPMCVLEAAGAGLPIILRDIPEYNDTFGNDAIRVDDDGFTDAVKKLREDKAFYKRQQQATKAIAQRFDSSTMAERLVRLYHDLL